MKSSIRTSAALMLCACLLTSCGDDETTSGEGGGEAWRPDPSVPTELGSDGFTPPDAVLSLGDSAVVPLFQEGHFDDPDVSGSLEVTVSEAPVKGSRDDLPEDGLFAAGHEGTPYYVTFDVKNVGDVTLEGVIITMTGVGAAGDGLNSSASTAFEPCPASIPQAFGPGQTANTCSVVFVDDEELAAVGYDEAEDYDDHPVLWDLT